MAKKKTPEFPGESTETSVGITQLSIDTGREDLNTIVAKLNEVINFLNK